MDMIKNGNIATVTTPDQVETTYGYDNMNRQTSVSKPGKDENNNTIIKVTTYNWEGKPLEATDSKQTLLKEVNEEYTKTQYVYSSRGLIEKVIDANLGVTYYEYDRAGRKMVEVSPNNYIVDTVLTELNRISISLEMSDINLVWRKTSDYL